MASAHFHATVVDDQNIIWSWGNNGNGRLGVNDASFPVGPLALQVGSP